MRAEWNLINSHGNEVPKVADFLGVSKSAENQSDLVAYSEIQANESDYLFQGSNIVQQVQNTVVAAASSNYDYQESGSNLQSLTLSMGSGKGSSTCETSGNNSPNTGDVAPRRTLDTFGQRTSIYRGVTRCVVVLYIYIYVLYISYFVSSFLFIYLFLVNIGYLGSKCRHRWTGRYEAHLWDNSCRREGQSRKGRQGN